MRIKLPVLVTFFASLIQVHSAVAQPRPIAPDEYIQSTSPLKTGGNMTGRTVQGTSRQQLITISQQPAPDQANSSVDYSNRDQFRLASNSNLSGAADQQPVSAQRPAQYDVYRYPSSTATQSNLTFRPTSFQARMQNDTALRTAQNCDCVPGAGGFQVPANTVPNLVYQPVQVAPQPVPQGQLYVPGTSFNGQAINPPGYGTATYGQAGFGSGRIGNWFRPLVTGTGVYRPIINLQGLQQGTYLGQGIIGQPTAYVNNQVLRNLLRYISP